MPTSVCLSKKATNALATLALLFVKSVGNSAAVSSRKEIGLHANHLWEKLSNQVSNGKI